MNSQHDKCQLVFFTTSENTQQRIAMYRLEWKNAAVWSRRWRGVPYEGLRGGGWTSACAVGKGLRGFVFGEGSPAGWVPQGCGHSKGFPYQSDLLATAAYCHSSQALPILQWVISLQDFPDISSFNHKMCNLWLCWEAYCFLDSICGSQSCLRQYSGKSGSCLVALLLQCQSLTSHKGSGDDEGAICEQRCMHELPQVWAVDYPV